jgi:hypothetical protein
MKDFIKTNEFVRNVNAFSELLMHLWWYSKDGRTMQIGETLDTLRDLRIKTRLKGEVLAKEVLEVCPDMKDLQYYFDQWTKRLDLIDTHFIYLYKDNELNFELGRRLDDEQAYLSLQGILRCMNWNYNDVMDGKKWLANTYSLQIKDDTDQEIIVDRNVCKIEKSKTTHTFRDLIQYENPDALLKRLHDLIDGSKRPMDIGLVICSAVRMNYLKREPGQKEFYSEFPNAGKWGSIRKYFHMYNESDDDEKEEHDKELDERASKIVIFD